MRAGAEKHFVINQNSAISLSLVVSLVGFFCWDFYSRGKFEGKFEERADAVERRLTRIERKIDGISRSTSSQASAPEKMQHEGCDSAASNNAAEHDPQPLWYPHAPECRADGLTNL